MINHGLWRLLMAKIGLHGRLLTVSRDGFMVGTMNGFLAICGICPEIMS
jgi:hypothetical protein